MWWSQRNHNNTAHALCMLDMQDYIRVHTRAHAPTHIRARKYAHTRTGKYIILIAFPRQQWLRERASMSPLRRNSANTSKDKGSAKSEAGFLRECTGNCFLWGREWICDCKDYIDRKRVCNLCNCSIFDIGSGCPVHLHVPLAVLNFQLRQTVCTQQWDTLFSASKAQSLVLNWLMGSSPLECHCPGCQDVGHRQSALVVLTEGQLKGFMARWCDIATSFLAYCIVPKISDSVVGMSLLFSYLTLHAVSVCDKWVAVTTTWHRDKVDSSHHRMAAW